MFRDHASKTYIHVCIVRRFKDIFIGRCGIFVSIIICTNYPCLSLSFFLNNFIHFYYPNSEKWVLRANNNNFQKKRKKNICLHQCNMRRKYYCVKCSLDKDHFINDNSYSKWVYAVVSRLTWEIFYWTFFSLSSLSFGTKMR